MRELIVRDDRELRRLDRAIADFASRPESDRLRRHHLLSALVAARYEMELARHRPVPRASAPL